MKLVVVTGVESSGKSTLAKALAARFDAPCVPEYAREFLAALTRPYTEADLPAIALGQLQAQQSAAANQPPLLLADTDLSVIAIWGLYKYGSAPPNVMQQLYLHLPDLYLLPHWDIGWKADPMRENPDPHSRQVLYNMYTELLQQTGVPVVPLVGTRQQRQQQAGQAIQKLLARP